MRAKVMLQPQFIATGMPAAKTYADLCVQAIIDWATSWLGGGGLYSRHLVCDDGNGEERPFGR